MPTSLKNMAVFSQELDGKITWWYVWSGYSIGPWDSEDRAIEELDKTKARLECASGGCEE